MKLKAVARGFAFILIVTGIYIFATLFACKLVKFYTIRVCVFVCVCVGGGLKTLSFIH